jgi:hypothetical protein
MQVGVRGNQHDAGPPDDGQPERKRNLFTILENDPKTKMSQLSW